MIKRLQTEELQIQIMGNENSVMVTADAAEYSRVPKDQQDQWDRLVTGTSTESFHLRTRDPGAPGQIPGNNIINCCGSEGPLNFFAVST